MRSLQFFRLLKTGILASATRGDRYVNKQTPEMSFHLNTAKQLTVLTPKLSDHCAFKSEKKLAWNIQMQGREKIIYKKDAKIPGKVKVTRIPNNGFCMIETKQQYQARIARITQKLISILVQYPEINQIELAEAAIKPEDIAIMADIIAQSLQSLPEWRDAQFGLTDFGLMTFIRTEPHERKFYVDEVLERQLEKHKLSTRCQTFTNGGNYKTSNIHVVHGKEEETLTRILTVIMRDALTKKLKRHDITGDFNLGHSKIKAIIETVWKNCCEELGANFNYSPTELTVHFDASCLGHRKANGTLVDADGGLRFEFRSNAANTCVAKPFDDFALRTAENLPDIVYPPAQQQSAHTHNTSAFFRNSNVANLKIPTTVSQKFSCQTHDVRAPF